ncbi:MAG: DNA polymerase III subunit delta' [Acetobacteraceae bacterium]
MAAPEPPENPDLLGHAAAERTLIEAVESGRLHHGWLITGPAGVGKATLAWRFARRLLAGFPAAAESLWLDPGNAVFRRVAAGGHADLRSITRTLDAKTGRRHREILVDDVRLGVAFLHLTAIEGGWRVVIVDPAELLNANAANALLKILEEPPAGALVLLVSAAPGRLPATLRSRCRMLKLSPLAEADMTALLARYLPDVAPEERARLGTLAEGSPGRALRLADEEGVAMAALVDEVLAGLPRFGTARAHAIADRLGRGESGFSTFMELLLATLSSAVRAGARGRADPDQERLLTLRPLEAWGEVWHALSLLTDETERFSLDKRQAVVSGIALLDRPLVHGP